MALTPDPTPTPPTDAPDQLLERAGLTLKQHTDQRWVEVSDRVLYRALRATRTSLPVRAQAPGGPIHISEAVIKAHVLATISSTPGAQIIDITIQTTDRDNYAGLTIIISAEYGTPLIPLADTMRNTASTTLRDLLGSIAPPVTVQTMDVDVADIHVGLANGYRLRQQS